MLFSRHELQVQWQKRRSKLATERYENKEALYTVPVPFWACAFINDFSYSKENKKGQAVHEPPAGEPSLAECT